ncbi:unnamed protein product, partial [Sphagnum compactum]
MASLTFLLQAPLQISTLCLRPSVKGKKEYCSSSAQVSYRVTPDFHRAKVRSPLVVSSLSGTVEPLLKSAGLRAVRQAVSASATASKELQELELQEEEVQSLEPRRSQSSDETWSSPTVVTFTIWCRLLSGLRIRISELVASCDHHRLWRVRGVCDRGPRAGAKVARSRAGCRAGALRVRRVGTAGSRHPGVPGRYPDSGHRQGLQKPPGFLSETLLVGISRIIGQPFSVDVTEQNPPYQIPFGMALLVRNIFTTPEHADG